jgi:hypothetical protein
MCASAGGSTQKLMQKRSCLNRTNFFGDDANTSIEFPGRSATVANDDIRKARRPVILFWKRLFPVWKFCRSRINKVPKKRKFQSTIHQCNNLSGLPFPCSGRQKHLPHVIENREQRKIAID